MMGGGMGRPQQVRQPQSQGGRRAETGRGSGILLQPGQISVADEVVFAAGAGAYHRRQHLLPAGPTLSGKAIDCIGTQARRGWILPAFATTRC